MSKIFEKIRNKYNELFPNYKSLAVKVFILVLCLQVVVGFIYKYNSDIAKQDEIDRTGKGQLPLEVDYWGAITIEIDYSEDLNINKLLYNYYIFDIFNYSKILVNIIWDQKLNVSSVTFSYDNCSEYALLMNRTRTYENAIHVLLLDNFTCNGVSNYWGYCMYLPFWIDMIANYSSPQYTGCLIAYSQIIKDTGNLLLPIKSICHEIGHALGCTHDQQHPSIMKQGLIIPILQFFFSLKSQLEMNPYNIFGVQKSFEIYKNES